MYKRRRRKHAHRRSNVQVKHRNRNRNRNRADGPGIDICHGVEKSFLSLFTCRFICYCFPPHYSPVVFPSHRRFLFFFFSFAQLQPPIFPSSLWWRFHDLLRPVHVQYDTNDLNDAKATNKHTCRGRKEKMKEKEIQNPTRYESAVRLCSIHFV